MNVKEEIYKKNEMYHYLLNHNYISFNKKSNYQQEMGIERAECIANKFNSLTSELQQENTDLKQKLSSIEELTSSQVNCFYKNPQELANKIKEILRGNNNVKN